MDDDTRTKLGDDDIATTFPGAEAKAAGSGLADPDTQDVDETDSSDMGDETDTGDTSDTTDTGDAGDTDATDAGGDTDATDA